jgi:hypothetical protein
MVRAILAVSVALSLLIPFSGALRCHFASFAHSMAGESYPLECDADTFNQLGERVDFFIDRFFRSEESKLQTIDDLIDREFSSAWNTPVTAQGFKQDGRGTAQVRAPWTVTEPPLGKA